MSRAGWLGALSIAPFAAGAGAISASYLPMARAFPPDAALLHLVGDLLSPLPLGPFHLAFGGVLTGIAAAIAGAIAAKIYADRRTTAAPVRKGATGGGREPARGDDERPDKVVAPAPPARVRLALPPEEPAAPDIPPEVADPGLPGDEIAPSL